MDITERIAGLPGWPVWMDGTSAVSTDSQEMDAARARLALAREWIKTQPHGIAPNGIDCQSFRKAPLARSCTCGRDALLAALEVPRG